MKERKKPTQSWIEKSKNEIEREEELLAKRMELLNDIRIKKLLYEDSEAFKVGYEAGFSKACEMLHDFAKTVYEMRKTQGDFSILNGRITYKVNNAVKVDKDEYLKHAELMNQMVALEDKVDAWIKENYPHLMEDKQ